MGTGAVGTTDSDKGAQFDQVRRSMDTLKNAITKLQHDRQQAEITLVTSLANELGQAKELIVESVFNRYNSWKLEDAKFLQRIEALSELSKKFENREKFLSDYHAAEVIDFMRRILEQKKEAAKKEEAVSDALQKEIEALEALLNELQAKKGRKAPKAEY